MNFRVIISKIIFRLNNLFLLNKFGKKNILFKGNKFLAHRSCKIKIHGSVSIKHSRIFLSENSSITIDKDSIIENADIFVNGHLSIGAESIINNGFSLRNSLINIEKGSLKIGSRNRIQNSFMIRFNGNVQIGNANNINTGSDIRCDEEVHIGSYNQISYNVLMWDTNTHNIYSATNRRALTDNYFPIFGYEYEKPQTKPITIGDDNWISRDVTILKGTEIHDKCIVGYGTIISNRIISSSSTVVPKIELNIFSNNL